MLVAEKDHIAIVSQSIDAGAKKVLFRDVKHCRNHTIEPALVFDQTSITQPNKFKITFESLYQRGPIFQGKQSCSHSECFSTQSNPTFNLIAYL
tara:strand:- start:865 stop:1146 length:282 start_codon:yes stop_codon:yes gene_type:complete